MGAQSRTQARTLGGRGTPQRTNPNWAVIWGFRMRFGWCGVVCGLSLSPPHFPALSRVGGYRTNRLLAPAIALPYSLSLSLCEGVPGHH